MSARRTVIALTVVALLARVATLDVQSFWSDEAATVDVLRHSFGGMLHAVWDGESTPPLFYVVAWLWSKLAGTGEVALRLPSALLGTATVPVVAALARRAAAGVVGDSGAGTAGRWSVPDRAAVAGAALAALSPLMVWYGQEARAYALLMLLTAASTLALLRVVEAPSGGRLATWAALAIAAFWSHHFAIFLVVGQACWALWLLRGRAVPAVVAVAAGAVGLAPLLLHQRAAGRASFIGDVPLHTRLAQVPKQVLVGYDGPAAALLVTVSALAVLVALAGLAVRPWRVWRASGTGPPAAALRDPSPGLIVLTVAAVGVLLPALAVLVGQDFLITRNLLGALPLTLALLATGAARLPGSTARLGAAAVAALTAVGAVSAIAVATTPAYQRDDFRAAIQAAVRGTQNPRLVVTEAGGRVPALLYLGSGTVVITPHHPRTVGEIDVVVVAGAEPGGTRTTPQLPASPPLPGGFVAAGEAHGETWAMRRFVAPTPVPIDSAQVAPLNPRGAPIVLYRPR
jgi:mannosyltransferase